MLLKLLTPGVGQPSLQALVLQVLLEVVKLLPADSALLKLTDAPCPHSKLSLHRRHAQALAYRLQHLRSTGELDCSLSDQALLA